MDTVNLILDWAGAVLLLAGAVLCLLAAIGLNRFPDLLSRMHATTKPQVLGIILVMFAIAITLRSLSVLATTLLVILFQMLTAPVASHMIARAAVLAGQVDLSQGGADCVPADDAANLDPPSDDSDEPAEEGSRA
ncbi:monovalent cation/H(+) antiporter subunit G [Granulicoccus phenolivorans]|uniref:monovalent cation/H(+) antiporter subunit G n=1 Tax=Granulicoccus phenolivorans TaxID=266854 RepID=UPI00041B5B2B|nr:monovalent cation/H(+) antiporter subunit G [Granulicoccus phenolivorans]